MTSPSPASLAAALPVPGRPPIAVRVRGLSRRFGDRAVLTGVDLDIARGEFVAVLGASGSGKSTFLRALAGLDPAATGEILAPRQRSIVFQDHRLLPWKRVWRNVVLGLAAGRGEAAAALDEVGIAHLADAWPLTLSGGEAQRVAVARAFVRKPALLLLDEPFGALDALTRIRAQRLLARLCDDHRPAVVLVTHDVDEALVLADRILVLDGGDFGEAITLPPGRPRDPARAGLADLRRQLLVRLGVGAEAGPHPTNGEP